VTAIGPATEFVAEREARAMRVSLCSWGSVAIYALGAVALALTRHKVSFLSQRPWIAPLLWATGGALVLPLCSCFQADAQDEQRQTRRGHQNQLQLVAAHASGWQLRKVWVIYDDTHHRYIDVLERALPDCQLAVAPGRLLGTAIWLHNLQVTAAQLRQQPESEATRQLIAHCETAQRLLRRPPRWATLEQLEDSIRQMRDEIQNMQPDPPVPPPPRLAIVSPSQAEAGS
jgi:hypothetical protein